MKGKVTNRKYGPRDINVNALAKTDFLYQKKFLDANKDGQPERRSGKKKGKKRAERFNGVDGSGRSAAEEVLAMVRFKG